MLMVSVFSPRYRRVLMKLEEMLFMVYWLVISIRMLDILPRFSHITSTKLPSRYDTKTNLHTSSSHCRPRLALSLISTGFTLLNTIAMFS